ncbi:MAG: hypothetical protein AMXMBFR81_09680 [Chthonomonas sp.]
MIQMTDRFFRPGGTLPPGTPSYVNRQADRDMVAALADGEYVFVLDARQKGKSSLIARASETLKADGVRTARVDLQRIGSNLTPEQWYAGLLHALGQELGLTAELFAHWSQFSALGPMARWFDALENVVLERVTGPVVVFVDEIDFVQSLAFDVDEFFAGIRECYNRRSSDDRFRRLTFCLAGVAAPSQLIRNEDLTPFNVGRSLRLADFSRDELKAYEAGLSTHGRNGAALQDAIFHWVSGHPYLTQLVGSWVAESPDVKTAHDVHGLIERLLLTDDARQTEPNLADVERRLLSASLPDVPDEEARSRVLDLLRLLQRGPTEVRQHDALLASILVLSGVANEVKGRLVLRNRLYARLLDRRWIEANLPGSEARRQKEAARRASLKLGSISLGIIVVLSSATAYLVGLTQQRDQALLVARALNADLERANYESAMMLASEYVGSGSVLRAREAIESVKEYPERGWEWRYLHRLLQGAEVIRTPASQDTEATVRGTWKEGGALIECVGEEVRRDGVTIGRLRGDIRRISSAGFWLLQSRGRGPLERRLDQVKVVLDQPDDRSVALSLDGRTLASGVINSRSIEVKDLATGASEIVATPVPVFSVNLSPLSRYIVVGGLSVTEELATYDRDHRRWLPGLGGSFSHDERLLVQSVNERLRVFDLTSHTTLASIEHEGLVQGPLWLKDGTRFATASLDGTVRLWEAATGKLLDVLTGALEPIMRFSLDEDERGVIVDGLRGSVCALKFKRAGRRDVVPAHADSISLARMSPNGQRLATWSRDGTGALLDVPTGSVVTRLRLGPKVQPSHIAFTRDGGRVAFVKADGGLVLVDPKNGQTVSNVAGPAGVRLVAALGSSELVSIAGSSLSVLDLDGRPLRTTSILRFTTPMVLAGSADGRWILVGDLSGSARLLDGGTLKEVWNHSVPSTHVRSGAFSADGRWMAVGNSRGTTLLVALADLRVRLLDGHASRTWFAEFSPDSKLLATTSYDGTARIWTVETGEVKAILSHPNWVPTARWSADGSRIATSCADGDVRVFEIERGRMLLRLGGHEGHVFDAEFAPDESTLVSVSGDGSVRFWRT